MDIKLGKKIRMLRKEKKLTQDELANSLNLKFNTAINKGMLSKWENDKEQPRLEFIINIADFFNVEISYLLGYEEKKYYLPKNKIREIINKYIPSIFDLVKSVCVENDWVRDKEEYTKLSLIIANEISKIDYYDVYDIFESEEFENIEKYMNMPYTNDIINNIKNNITEINILKEMEEVIDEAYSYDEFYGLDLRESIQELVNDKQLTEVIVKSFYKSQLIMDISSNISELIETSYLDIIIREVLFMHFQGLNLIGKEKVIDYIKDLLSNDKYKEGE